MTDPRELEDRIEQDGLAARDLIACEGWEWFEHMLRMKVSEIEARILGQPLSERDYHVNHERRRVLQVVLEAPAVAIREHNKLLQARQQKENDRAHRL